MTKDQENKICELSKSINKFSDNLIWVLDNYEHKFNIETLAEIEDLLYKAHNKAVKRIGFDIY